MLLWSLAVRRGKLQILNFYRHLQGSRGGIACKALKEIIKKTNNYPHQVK